jgi:hypothetical protein
MTNSELDRIALLYGADTLAADVVQEVKRLRAVLIKIADGHLARTETIDVARKAIDTELIPSYLPPPGPSGDGDPHGSR